MTASLVAPERGFDRTPPTDQHAEACVLGAMLLSKDAITTAVERLPGGTDFYQPKHQTIFNVIAGLYAAGRPADPVTVAAALADAGELQRIGGVPYLHSLVEAVPSVGSVGYYADIVADRAVKRRLIVAGMRITGFGFADGDTADAISRAHAEMNGVVTGRDTSTTSMFAQGVQAALDQIEANATASEPAGLASPWPDLNDLLGGGGQPGQLIIVAGRPGMGKSTVGLNWAEHVAIAQGMPALFVSLEMSTVEVILRTLSAQARVPLHVLRSGKLTDVDWTKLARRIGEIGEAPLLIDDTPNLTLLEIRARAMRVQQHHDLKMIVVDYLQLMNTPKRGENRQQEVAELSRGLKLLAKETNTLVVAVSQLNRGPEQRADKRPQLGDLRESGSLEQDADVVILLHRDDYYDKESPRAGEADFIVAKHRNGPTDTITVAAQLHLSRFCSLAMA